MYSGNKVKTKRRIGYGLVEVLREEIVKDNLPSKVDPAGYVDPNVKIQDAIKAGIRIDEWNRALYDFDNPDSDAARMHEEDYINDDLYKDELELLEAGYNSLDIYQTRMRRLYDQYLEQSKGNHTKSTSNGSEPPLDANTAVSQKEGDLEG